MMNAHSEETVAHDMFALLHQSAAPVVTRWTFSSDDPFAVTLVIQTRGDQCVDWVLARDLLVSGLTGPAGIGDVRVRPARLAEWDVALVELRSPEGRALLEVDRELLQQFVDATVEAIPLGHEGDFIDMDSEIEKIMRSCAG